MLTLSFLINPIFGVITGFKYYIKLHKNHFIFLPIILTLSLILSTQQATGVDTIDIANYYRLFINSDWGNLNPKYIFYSLVQSFFHLNLKLNFSIFVFLQYAIYYSSCIYFAHFFRLNTSSRLSHQKFLFIVFGIINFVQTGELLRQNIAVISTLFALKFLIQDKKITSLFMIAVGLGIHHTTVIYGSLLLGSQYVTSSFLIILICLISANFNLNVAMIKMTCQSETLRFFCRQASTFLKLNWEAKLNEHYSLLFLGFTPLILLLKGAILRLKRLNLIDRFCLIYFFFIIGNLSTDHNFIRFINTSSPFFAIMFSRAYDSSLKNRFTHRIITLIGLLFIVYNTAAIYKRTTREGYQSSYLYGNALNLVSMFTWEHFSDKLSNPDRRIKKASSQ